MENAPYIEEWSPSMYATKDDLAEENGRLRNNIATFEARVKELEVENRRYFADATFFAGESLEATHARDQARRQVAALREGLRKAAYMVRENCLTPGGNPFALQELEHLALSTTDHPGVLCEVEPVGEKDTTAPGLINWLGGEVPNGTRLYREKTK